MLQIIKEVVANLSILISSAYLLSKLSKTILNHQSPHWHKFLLGLFNGIIGIILMNFSIQYHNGFLIDIRLVPIVMVSFFFGGIAPVVAGVLVGIVRLFYGLSPTVISVCLTYCFIGISQYFISKWLLRFSSRWRLWLTFLTVITPVIINFLLNTTFPNRWPIVFYFTTYNIFGVIISYQFAKDLDSSKRTFLRYEEASKYDYLTRIYNRYSFDRNLTKLFKEETIITIFLLDINDFKQINDTYGHDIGDQVLQEFAQCLNQPNYFKNQLYRLGGDEFVVVVPKKLTDQETLETKLLIKKTIHQLTIHTFAADFTHISTSVGSSTSENLHSIDTLYRQADQQLYQDKKMKTHHKNN